MRTIVRVITRLNVGGPARQVATLTAASESQGFRTVLVSGVEDPDEEDLLEELSSRGVRPTRLDSLRRAVDLRRDARSVRELRALIRQHRPDIVHTHTAKAGAVGRWAAWRERVPNIVHTFHGHSLRGYFSPLRSRCHLAIERFLAKRSHALLCVSRADAEELSALGVGSPTVIRSGVELAEFGSEDALARGRACREAWNVPPEAIVVGWAGRLTPIKRVDLLCDTVQRLGQRSPVPIWTVVAGVGPERHRLEHMLRERPELRLRLIGRQTDMPAFWAASDIGILTSDREGLPLALIEAQASRRPVVATDVGGVGEILVEEETGIRVPPGDAEALAAAILKLAQDGDARARLGHEGRRRALAEFSAERLVTETYALYSSLLQSRAEE